MFKLGMFKLMLGCGIFNGVNGLLILLVFLMWMDCVWCDWSLVIVIVTVVIGAFCPKLSMVWYVLSVNMFNVQCLGVDTT